MRLTSRYSTELLCKIADKLICKGFSDKHIAYLYKVSPSTVAKVKERLGLTPRKKITKNGFLG